MKGTERLRSLWARLRGTSRPPIAQVAKEELARYLPDDPVIVEAGAHSGQDTVELAQQWPRGIIHAFEPVPSLFAQLELRTTDLPNVRRWRHALSDRTGRQSLHLSEGGSDGSSSLLAPDRHLDVHPEVHFLRKIEVEAVTLDDWMRHEAIPRVDFLWLDLQGMEPAALQSSPHLVAQLRAIHTEVSLLPVYAGAPLYPDFRHWMEAQGFAVAREILPFQDMGNVLFVRRP